MVHDLVTSKFRKDNYKDITCFYCIKMAINTSNLKLLGMLKLCYRLKDNSRIKKIKEKRW